MWEQRCFVRIAMDASRYGLRMADIRLIALYQNKPEFFAENGEKVNNRQEIGVGERNIKSAVLQKIK